MLAMFSKFPDVFGPTRIGSNLVGHIRMLSDAFGMSLEKIFEKVEKTREHFCESVVSIEGRRGYWFQMSCRLWDVHSRMPTSR